MRCWLLVVMLIVSCSVTDRGRAAPPEFQDLVFRGLPKPMRIRLRVQVDGMPFLKAWEESLSRMFRILDVNQDSVLDAVEAERMAPVQALLGFNAFGAFFPASIDSVDTDCDGRISRGEFDEYFRRSGGGPIQLEFSRAQRGFDWEYLKHLEELLAAPPDAFFALLDVGKDSNLSGADLSAAPHLLHRLDENEDELLVLAEIAPGAQQPERPAGPQFELLAPGAPPAWLGNWLWMDAPRLARFLDRSPDMELVIRLGRKREVEPVIEVFKPDQKSVVGRRVGQQAIAFDIGPTRMEFRVEDRPTRTASVVRRECLTLFRAADANVDGQLRRKEAALVPLYHSQFNQIDQNGDRRLSEAEVVRYLDTTQPLQPPALGACVSVSINGPSRCLFDLVDTNADDVLTPRELSRLPDLVDRLDRDGDGRLSGREILQHYEIVIRRGPAVEGYPAGYTRTGASSRVGTHGRSPEGPLWFRRLDRNGDGDLSRREFPGTEAEFQRLDANGDGLISPEEADLPRPNRSPDR